jgi:hypothetical protein
MHGHSLPVSLLIATSTDMMYQKLVPTPKGAVQKVLHHTHCGCRFAHAQEQNSGAVTHDAASAHSNGPEQQTMLL